MQIQKREYVSTQLWDIATYNIKKYVDQNSIYEIQQKLFMVLLEPNMDSHVKIQLVVSKHIKIFYSEYSANCKFLTNIWICPMQRSMRK